MNWRGRPLTSHEVIVQSHRRHHHPRRATVRAELDTATYPPGAKISDEQMAALPLHRHDWHGDWNYTLYPAPPAPAAAPRPGPAAASAPAGPTRP